MNPKFICHSDFENEMPKNVFHKEADTTDFSEKDSKFLNRHILFRKKLSINECAKAIIKISADDYYKLYINGKFVTMGPASAYPSSYYYNEIDVTNYLVAGENTFAVHTYYQGLINRVWVSGDRRQMMWLELLVDGVTRLVSDESWLCAEHTAYSEMGTVGYETAFLERYDSRAPEVNFYLPDFDDALWANAKVFKNADYVIKKQPTKQLEIYEVEPIKIETDENCMQIDFGREYVGYLNIVAKGSRGSIVKVRCAEELNQDGTPRYDMRCYVKYEEEWILSGGSDSLNQFDYKAFRYVELTFDDSVTVEKVSMTVRHYPFELLADYGNPSDELKKILNLCIDTVKYGTQEIFMDCPTREKGQYLGDLSISGRAHAVMTKDTKMLKKAISNFCESSFICPGIMAVSVSSLMQEIADYSLQLPAVVTWLYHFDGDKDFVRYTEPYLTGMYNYFSKYRTECGLLRSVGEKWNMVDWPENLRDGYDFPLTRPIVADGEHNVINAFWCGFLDALDEVYDILDMPRINIAEDIKNAFFDTFYSAELGLYCDNASKSHAAVHSNILPLLFNIGTERDGVKENLIDFIAKKGLSSAGVYMAYFTLAALINHGERELAEKLATDERCWINMINEGATSTFEAWGKDQKWNTSLFHPWAVAPAVVFAKISRIY